MEKRLITNWKYTFKYPYYATDDGRIYSSYSNKYMCPQLDKDGYEKVALMCIDSRHRFSVHRLILETFNPVDNMRELQVNHIDGNKQNNALSNLEWVTCSENIKHAYANKLHSQTGSRNAASKLTEGQVLEIIDLLLQRKYTYAEIGAKYGVNEDTIGAIKRKQNWTFLTKDISFD